MNSNRGKARLMISSRGLLLSAVLLVTAGTAMAQQGPARGKLEPLKDPELELACKHNLEVARWYLNKRKAYPGARDRLQEIIDSYPDFSRIDEVIYMMGQVNEKLKKNDDAAKYYIQVVKSYPGSQFFKKAKDRLAQLKVDPNAAGDSDANQSTPGDKKPDTPKDNSKDGSKKPQGTPGPPPPF